MKVTRILLGVDCNFAANRYTEPEVWTEIVAKKLGLRYVQYATDLLDPYLPLSIQERVCRETLQACQKRGLTIYNTFGGNLARQHWLGHPDEEIRREAENWLKRLIYQASLLEAEGTGVCFGIMTVRYSEDPQRRQYLIEEMVQAYRRLAHYARREGLKYLMFEPMSVPREMACTIKETRMLLSLLENLEVPMKLCLDVGHGDVSSDDPADSDPYAWIREFGPLAPTIHIQQTDKEASRHWPFTEKYNRIGVIRPQEIVKAIGDSGAEEVLLALEVTHRAFYPDEYRVIKDLKESVDYWREFVNG